MATGDKKRAVMTDDIGNSDSIYPVMPLTTIDSAPDATHTGNLISSAAVAEGLATTADKTDLASIQATGTTNTTGSTISAGTYFYLNGVLVQAITDIASNATFTSGTNYTAVTAGGLNQLNSDLNAKTPLYFILAPGKKLTIAPTANYDPQTYLITTASNRADLVASYIVHNYWGASYIKITPLETGADISCAAVGTAGGGVIISNNNSTYTTNVSVLILFGDINRINFTIS